MVLTDFACVLADTARSRAYIQTLLQHDMIPAKCLVMSEGAGVKISREIPCKWDAQQFFDLDESIFETMETHGISYKVVASRDINGDEMRSAIQEFPQQYILYSGYGGAILRPHLFRMGKRWIHVHAGILPFYRGSTTAYYSLLDCDKMGAAAIFLNERIDEGSVIASEEFPPPPRGEFVDYVYDPYIRAQVLVKALKSYIQNGEFHEMPQTAQGAETYYIIHPVLKHIAILGVDFNEETK
nr:formyltransferase family protein [uncultured Oscillibacter sp.]